MKHPNTVQSHNQTAVRTYRFAFGADENLYTVSFKGVIPEQGIRRMLETARRTLYAKCSEAIRLYLDTCQLEYSDFTSCRNHLESDTVMAAANSLLHGSSCDGINQWTGNADTYYAVMDHQRQIAESSHEGCYFAVSKTLTGQDNFYEYHVIGQTFLYDTSSGKEQAYFAIRQGKDGRRLHTLNETTGRPPLAAFGCVDVMTLLLNIGSITTAEQAARLANR